jgi:hypothetical protein
MSVKCNGCKYAGDVDDICPKYKMGIDGYSILQEFYPLLCKDCPSRVVHFCQRYNDDICIMKQDPFDCKIDLEKDKLWGIELLQKHLEIGESSMKKNIHKE